MKAKGLGTGLGALFGDAAIVEPAGDFEYLPIMRIEPRKEQPRGVFEQEKIDELADSIREHGVLSPLTVRRVGDGYYQIVAGERRWRAARKAGIEEIPVRVIEADDKKALELALVENLQREDLTPIEEARGYRVLMDDFGITQEEVARKVSKSRPTVANALRLLALPEELVQLIGEGALSAGSARALLALKSNDMMRFAAKEAATNEMSVREVEALVKRLIKENQDAIKPGQKKSCADTTEIDYMAEAQTSLTKALGRKVTVRQNGEKGKIEIEYHGHDDFNELYDILTTGT